VWTGEVEHTYAFGGRVFGTVSAYYNDVRGLIGLAQSGGQFPGPIVIEQVQEFGCVIKDLDMGLIDFPTLLRGVEVYLCWKLGEPTIAHWHGTSEGFASRKPIDERIANAGKKRGK